MGKRGCATHPISKSKKKNRKRKQKRKKKRKEKEKEKKRKKMFDNSLQEKYELLVLILAVIDRRNQDLFTYRYQIQYHRIPNLLFYV